MIEGQISEFRSKPTMQGYTLVLKTFKHSIWIEAYTSSVVFGLSDGPMKQDAFLSRLSFQSGSTRAEMLDCLRNWAASYGREFVTEALTAFNSFYQELDELTVPQMLQVPATSSRNSN